MNGKLYMDIPYDDKEQAKALGARWDSEIKKWYYEGAVKDYIKFAKWLINDSVEAVIACEHLFILEGKRVCYKCKKETAVIALGIGENILISTDKDGKYTIRIEEDCVGWEPIHLAWVEDERDIPPILLNHLKENYSVKTGYSKIAGQCFANHCDHCGAIQGNNYVMEEDDSPLSTYIPGGQELQERISKVKIKMFSIDDNLLLNWSVNYSENDDAYFKYATSEEIIIAPSDEDWITYKELYGL